MERWARRIGFTLVLALLLVLPAPAAARWHELASDTATGDPPAVFKLAYVRGARIFRFSFEGSPLQQLDGSAEVKCFRGKHSRSREIEVFGPTPLFLTQQVTMRHADYCGADALVLGSTAGTLTLHIEAKKHR